MEIGNVEWSVTVRPMPGERLSGDLGLVERLGDKLFIALIDGAGHGPQANEVAQQCVGFLEGRYAEMSLPKLMSDLHAELLGGRGAVVSLCWLDMVGGFVEYLGIGNISARIYGNGHHEFISRSGLVGSSFSAVRNEVERVDMARGDLLVLHSDGISSRSRVDQIDGLTEANVKVISNEMIEKFGRDTDDASCIAVRR